MIDEAKLQIGGYEFALIGPIEPLRDDHGRILEEMPQSRYRNAKGLSLHHYGTGPFFRFRVPAATRDAGVYAITVDKLLKYIGKCDNLKERYGPRGYGVIHPRNCFEKGQPTNCRINNLILRELQTQREAHLWFRQEDDKDARSSLEAELIQLLKPEWNRQFPT